MKKIIGEFKKFVTRGNIVDMAVGVIVGSSFTAIVNALSNNIFKPIINYLLTLIFGANSLSEVYTFLKRVDTVAEDGTVTVDLANSIFIDWGAFINAVINFLLIALVLFSIVKFINKIKINNFFCGNIFTLLDFRNCFFSIINSPADNHHYNNSTYPIENSTNTQKCPWVFFLMLQFVD